MKRLTLSAAFSAALFVGCAGITYAADIDTKATKAPPPPSGPTTCTSVQDFFLTGCQLTWYGVRMFGAIDVGGYQTNGAPFDRNFITGASYFLQKMNRTAMWGLARQNTLTLDGVLAYDPMGGAYAFSPIDFSGVVAGGGDTQTERFSTSAKYRVNIGDFRVAALGQFGGYELNNGARGAYEGQIGGDVHTMGGGVLSFDALVDYSRDAVNLSLAGAPTKF
jgi:hypothetical protein